MPPEPADDRCMTITEHPSSAAEGEDLPRRALEAVCARGPIVVAGEIGDATHLLVERLRKPQNLDRKSTRLNSSHVANSSAVFCFKRKNNHDIATDTNTY